MKGTSFIKTLATMFWAQELAALTVLAGVGVAAQTTALAAAPVYPGCIASSWSECKNSHAVERDRRVRHRRLLSKSSSACSMAALSIAA